MNHKNNNYPPICVWGSGPWASFTLSTLTELGVKTLVSGGAPGSESRAHRLQKLARVFGAQSVTDADQVTATGCRAVILALPPDQNSYYGKLFLRQGLDVFIQKPLAATYEEAHELFQVATEEKRILMGGSDIALRPDIMKAKALIQQGYIGQPRYLHGQFCHVIERSSWRHDIFQDMGEHVITVVRELMGTPEQTVIKRSGVFSGQFYFEANGWFADVRLSWESYRGRAPEIIVEGTQGNLHLNTSDLNEIDCYKVRGWVGGGLARIPRLREWLTNSHEKVRCEGPHSYSRKLDEFLKAVTTGAPTTSFLEELETFRILCDAMGPPAAVATAADQSSKVAR